MWAPGGTASRRDSAGKSNPAGKGLRGCRCQQFKLAPQMSPVECPQPRQCFSRTAFFDLAGKALTKKAARGAAETTRRADIGSPTEIGRPDEFVRFFGDGLLARRRLLVRNGVAGFSRDRRGRLLTDRRGTAAASRGDHHRESAADDRPVGAEQTGSCCRFDLHSRNSPFFIVKEVSRNDLIHGRGK